MWLFYIGGKQGEGRRRIREIAISNMVKNGFEKDMIDDVAKNCKNRLEKNLDGWTESSECQTHLTDSSRGFLQNFYKIFEKFL